jgi:hypothetical protein
VNSINPDTLLEESEFQKKLRQRETGVIGNGLTVRCAPYEDKTIVQFQHRAVCLYQPYQACPQCPHSNFTLIFNPEKDRYAQVACPRWASPGGRMKGEDPEHYVPVEIATCEQRPFDFCSSCPSMEEVAECSVDKVSPGWYSRWHRLKKILSEEEDDD